VRDSFKLGAIGIDDAFLINGNTWVFNTAHIVLVMLDPNPSSIFSDDSLGQPISASTPWAWEQIMLKFTLQGVQNSEHYLRLGSGQPKDVNVDIISSLNRAASLPAPAPVPAPATLPLLAAALGLLGLRRRRS
jgi:hypothetical protein